MLRMAGRLHRYRTGARFALPYPRLYTRTTKISHCCHVVACSRRFALLVRVSICAPFLGVTFLSYVASEIYFFHRHNTERTSPRSKQMSSVPRTRSCWTWRASFRRQMPPIFSW